MTKFGFKNMEHKSRGSSPKKSNSFRPRSNSKPIDYVAAQANEARARDYRLDRIHEIQHEIYQDTPEWSPEDKQLIDFVWNNFKANEFPVLGTYVWEQFTTQFAEGPRGPKATNGQFSAMLQFIKQTICAKMQENK